MDELIHRTARMAGLVIVLISHLMTRSYVALVAPRSRDERGDVPGWVLVTVMSAGLVMAIWGVAEGQLQQMLRAALNQVK